jgi:1,4-dihydroxy-2-naphthoyl-CoA hydrolase
VVRFHEIDRAGIVYFATIFQYCHEAYEDLLVELVGNLEEFFRTKDWGLPLVHAEADYAQPLRLGDRVKISLRPARVGERSVTYEYTLTDEATGAPRATVRLVHACITVPGFASRPLPDDVRAGLARLGLV